ncbi:MAG: tRNA (adenosine(37)-N6)-threonylcarbamoyltransferase complex ATPase subunit type 1 TsaE [Parcubacteria group bacterium GW2011_GWA2_38_13b]|nr:MAG: tRNA (adenosine(37)-N6)-threonylcarbamoyltransferase complex ATPase subunit type 1 TsaE [Parcubacteria group bacterium GW2011_GWA2_38_13b]
MKSTVKLAENMKKIGMKMAEKIIGRKKRNAVIIALTGELGSGKTTFAQGFLEYFGIKRANSPTFVIMKKYLPAKIFQKKNFSRQDQILYLYHIDCYRIHSSRDLVELGFNEIAKDFHNVILIEWAERINDLLPKNTIRISFKHKSEKERIINYD